MSDQIYMPISSNLFARLQRLAVPPAYDASLVIEKLIDHWEANPENGSVMSTLVAAPTKSEVWRSPRGDSLPVGAALQAKYLGKTFCVTVKKNGISLAGKLYDSPSAAGVAVKGQFGRTGRAASTDGRTFWKIKDPSSGRWVSISSLQPPASLHDSDSMVAEIKAGR